MNKSLSIKILKAIQRGLYEGLSDYNLTILDDEDSVVVKDNNYKHLSIYDSLVDNLLDKLPEFLDDDKAFKNIVEKAIITNKQYIVKDKNELKTLINKSIEVFGNECDLNWINTSEITDMSNLFNGMKYFNGHIEKWDVSNVKNITHMFDYAASFNQPLNNWDVSNVENMSYMFWNALSFNQPLNNWDVSNVENMHGMFTFADSFNQPLNNWDVSNVEDMSYMFNGAVSFNQPLNNWNILKIKNNKINIFNNCPIKEEYKPKNI